MKNRARERAREREQASERARARARMSEGEIFLEVYSLFKYKLLQDRIFNEIRRSICVSV